MNVDCKVRHMVLPMYNYPEYTLIMNENKWILLKKKTYLRVNDVEGLVT